MMTCGEVMRLLESYLLGSLDAETSQQISRHFGHCPSCQLVLTGARQTLKQLSEEILLR